MLQSQTDIEWFNKALLANPIAADAASFGMVSGPRIWWSRVDWTKITENPYELGKPLLKWEKVNGMHKLQLCLNKDEPNSFEMTGLNQKRLIPCLTTPAPTDAGRPIPKRMKGPISPEVKQRWLEGGKQYAPWIYEAHGVVYEANGQGQLLPAELKEQLHHYPAGFTRHSKLNPGIVVGC